MTDLSTSIQGIAAPLGISTSDPQVASALASLQSEAAAEGVSVQETLSRVHTLFDAYQGIYSHGNVDASKALDAARQFVSANHEVSGAIDIAGGLLKVGQAAASGAMNPPQLVASFSGPVIAMMTAAGAVSAGTGAAIVAGIALASALMDQAGIFPTRPGFDVCPGFKITTPNPPDFAIGCIAVFDPLGAITPGSKQWRAFPEKNNAADAWWYSSDPNGPPFVDWKNARWITSKAVLNLASPIIAAFPETMVVTEDPNFWTTEGWPDTLAKSGVLPANMSGEQFAALADFQTAFAQAWKANKEFWINGRRGADDVTVLEHFTRIWNRAHQPGQGLDVGPAPAGSLMNIAGGGVIAYAPFFTTLIMQLGRANATDVMADDGARLHINTGPLKRQKGAFQRGAAARAAARAATAARLGSALSRFAASAKKTNVAKHAVEALPLGVGAFGIASGIAMLAIGAPLAGAIVAAAGIAGAIGLEKRKS